MVAPRHPLYPQPPSRQAQTHWWSPSTLMYHPKITTRRFERRRRGCREKLSCREGGESGIFYEIKNAKRKFNLHNRRAARQFSAYFTSHRLSTTLTTQTRSIAIHCDADPHRDTAPPIAILREAARLHAKLSIGIVFQRFPTHSRHLVTDPSHVPRHRHHSPPTM